MAAGHVSGNALLTIKKNPSIDHFRYIKIQLDSKV